MRNFLYLVGIITILGTCSYLGYEVVRMDGLIDAGAGMSRTAKKFDRPIDNKKEILVLGDSLAFGVGVAKPEDSFAGILAERFDKKSVENNAEIGETIGSLQKTLDKKLIGHYEQVYIIVGGNDIMRMHINIFSSKRSLRTLVTNASQHADQVFLVTTGDFSNVSLSPWLLRSAYGMRANMIREVALDLEDELDNFDYVDFYAARIKRDDYKQLEAADGYHLNEHGIERLVATMLISR